MWYRKVIKELAPEGVKSGNIVDEDGNVVAKHEGIIGYTVGQRKGLGGGMKNPKYVVEIKPKTHEVVIGPKESLLKTEFSVKEVNWLADEPLDGAKVWAKIRAQHVPAKATLKDLGNGRVRVIFDTLQEQISPGQAAVFYDSDNAMLGGGWIEG